MLARQKPAPSKPRLPFLKHQPDLSAQTSKASHASHREAFLFASNTSAVARIGQKLKWPQATAGSPESWILMEILRLRNPPPIADPPQDPGVFSGMNEPGEALHVERASMTGSEKGCSHVYSY
jgi:hypothetical protein